MILRPFSYINKSGGTVITTGLDESDRGSTNRFTLAGATLVPPSDPVVTKATPQHGGQPPAQIAIDIRHAYILSPRPAPDH